MYIDIQIKKKITLLKKIANTGLFLKNRYQREYLPTAHPTLIGN